MANGAVILDFGSREQWDSLKTCTKERVKRRGSGTELQMEKQLDEKLDEKDHAR